MKVRIVGQRFQTPLLRCSGVPAEKLSQSVRRAIFAIIALSVTATSTMIAIVGTAKCGGLSSEVPVRCGAGSKRPRISATPMIISGTMRNRWILRRESGLCNQGRNDARCDRRRMSEVGLLGCSISSMMGFEELFSCKRLEL